MRIYLDNCCYNRPYDDQSNVSISIETQAKLHIQELIKNKKIQLASSYMLRYENNENPYEMRKKAIEAFISENEFIYVSTKSQSKVEDIAKDIMLTGVKYKDACHVACAILSKCDYFLTTDKRLLKYRSDKVKLINPVNLLSELEV